MNIKHLRPTSEKEEKNERKHFDSKANVYDAQYGYNNPFTKYKISKKSVDFANFVNSNFPDGNVKILEIGCGTGEYTKIVSGLLPKAKITAIDISGESIANAKKKCANRNNITFAVKSAYNTGFKDNSFDIVFGYYILHHLDVKKTATEVYRVLRKSGIGFFYEPNILNPYVYLVKRNKWLKNRVGDSPDEWALNPLYVPNDFSKFKVEIILSEYVLPLSFLDINIMKKIDFVLNYISKIPILKYLGGSVQIKIFKY